MANFKKLLVTGASGFIGRALMDELAKRDDLRVIGTVRDNTWSGYANHVAIGSIHEATDWTEAVAGKGVIIHTAGRAHIMSEGAADPLAEFRLVNTEGTLNLARQAATAGVGRFIFLSSIKVNGERTPLDEPFTAEDKPDPLDPYGVSKLEAELGLFEISRKTGMEVVVIRPPLVYGPGVKGNFASMAKLVREGVPLPLGAVHNRRSMVGLGNLIDLVATCVDHPAAANQVFLASDGRDLSTTELLRCLGSALGKSSRLVPVPAGFLQFGAKVIGKEAVAQRVLGSLQVDISKTRELLSWEPPLSVEEGLGRCIRSL